MTHDLVAKLGYGLRTAVRIWLALVGAMQISGLGGWFMFNVPLAPPAIIYVVVDVLLFCAAFAWLTLVLGVRPAKRAVAQIRPA